MSTNDLFKAGGILLVVLILASIVSSILGPKVSGMLKGGSYEDGDYEEDYEDESYTQGRLQKAANQGKPSFTLKVVRTGTTDGSIQTAFFNPTDAQAGYYKGITTSTLVDLTIGISGGFILTTGTPNTFTTRTFANRHKVIMKYTNDTVTLMTSSAAPYPSLIEMLKVDIIEVLGFRMSVSTSDLTQFAEDINVYSSRIFGNFGVVSFNPDTDKNPHQTQTNIIDVPKGFILDYNQGLRTNLVAVAHTVTYTFMVKSAEINSGKKGFVANT